LIEGRNETLLFSVSLFFRTTNSSDVKHKTKHQFFNSAAITKFSAEFCDLPYADLTAVFIKRFQLCSCPWSEVQIRFLST